MHFPGGSDSKESACNAGNLGSIPGLGRSPGEGNGNPLQYSCLENPKDRRAWQATVPGVEKSWTQLSDFTFTFLCPQILTITWQSLSNPNQALIPPYVERPALNQSPRPPKSWLCPPYSETLWLWSGTLSYHSKNKFISSTSTGFSLPSGMWLLQLASLFCTTIGLPWWLSW